MCPAGLNCRFAAGHVREGKNVDRSGTVLVPKCGWHQEIPHIGVIPGEKNIFGEEPFSQWKRLSFNLPLVQELRVSLRKKTYDFTRAESLAKAWKSYEQLPFRRFPLWRLGMIGTRNGPKMRTRATSATLRRRMPCASWGPWWRRSGSASTSPTRGQRRRDLLSLWLFLLVIPIKTTARKEQMGL